MLSISFTNITDGILTCNVITSDMTVGFSFYNGADTVTGIFSYKNVNSYAVSHITLNPITGTQDTSTLY
jgi:hypothetical protein